MRTPPLDVWLTDVRMRAADKITAYICEGFVHPHYEGEEAIPDSADVHEDVREDLYQFFDEIKSRIEAIQRGS